MALHVRTLTEEEAQTIKKWSQSRTEEARLVERATIIRLASEGHRVPEIAKMVGLDEKTVRKWLKRFGEQGLDGLEDAPRSGAPLHYTPEVKAQIIAAALTNPREVGCQFNCWTFEQKGCCQRPMSCSIPGSKSNWARSLPTSKRSTPSKPSLRKQSAPSVHAGKRGLAILHALLCLLYASFSSGTIEQVN